MTEGIYRIVNLETGDFYIGRTVDLRARENKHWRDSRNGTNSCRRLQAAWDQWGEDAFEFEVLMTAEDASIEDMEALEQAYLDTFVGKPECYNDTTDARVPDEEGRKRARKTQKEKGLGVWDPAVRALGEAGRIEGRKLGLEVRRAKMKPNECGHPERPRYAKGMCRQCYRKDLRGRKELEAENSELKAKLEAMKRDLKQYRLRERVDKLLSGPPGSQAGITAWRDWKRRTDEAIAAAQEE